MAGENPYGTDEAGERGGMAPRQIVAILLVLAALIGGGLWLTGAIRGTAGIQDCVAAGRTNCAPAG